jgi:hypothetical protein
MLPDTDTVAGDGVGDGLGVGLCPGDPPVEGAHATSRTSATARNARLMDVKP